MKSAFASISLLILLSAGCVPINYSQYHGTDATSFAGSWPTGLGAMADTTYAVPVYHGWPERPYELLGSLSFPDPNKTWDAGIIAAAASFARKHHGDAIVIRQGEEFGVVGFAGLKNSSTFSASNSRTTALVVRWLSAEEVQQQQATVEKMRLQFEAEHPNVSANNDAFDLLVKFLAQTYGFTHPGEEFYRHFKQDAAALTSSDTGDLSGNWLFKTTFSAGDSISGGTEKTFIGIAHVGLDGTNISIVSTKGKLEINFSGTLERGRATGELGVGNFGSFKSEGAATADKIALSFRSLTPDGSLSGNVVFQRFPIIQQRQKTNEKSKSAYNRDRDCQRSLLALGASS